MSTGQPLTSGTIADPPAPEDLVRAVAALGARPFQHQVVQSPWHTIVDAPGLHRDVKDRIRSLVDTCGQPQAIRCLTVTAPPGYGKTHLLAWTRETLDHRNDAVFVYVPPYTPGGPGGVSPEQHVMRATLDALWLRSRRQQVCFEQAVRSFLAGCYDRVIDSGQGIKELLRAGTFWSRLFRRSRLRIGPQGAQDQLAALQRAFDRRGFLERAFAEFVQRPPSSADGVYPDRDTFVAACLLACGDTRQRWHADRWFRGDLIPPDVLEPFHLDHPCQGTEKIRNGLFTLNALLNQVFCVSFDQLEDTYVALQEPGGSAGTRFAQMLGLLLRNLSVMPRFCLLFMCQQSVWQAFIQSAPPMLIDRMVEGHGVQVLRPLDDGAAQELVRWRLCTAVWGQLPALSPPAEVPLFPFTAAEIRQVRIDTGGEPRPFLQRVEELFQQRLQTPLTPLPKAPLRLTGIEPKEVMSHEPTAVLIRGDNLPAEVCVFFAGAVPPTPPVCRAMEGEIDVTTPGGLVGDVEVRVQAADDAGNVATLTLRFVEREVPRPYHQHIDRYLLKARREELKLTQKQVAEKIGSQQPYVSQLETGKWKNAPDELYVRLTGVYGKPLSYFLKH